MRKTIGPPAVVVAVLLTTAGCEPATLTEARNQLGRNPGTVSYVLPIADTTYLVSDLLDDAVTTVTLPSGILGVEVQADTFSVFSFPDQLMTQTVTTTVAYPTPAFGAPGNIRDTIFFATPQGSDVLDATVDAGYVVRIITNNTGCSGSASATLSDTLGTGTVFLTFPSVTVNDGQTVVDSIDMTNLTVPGVVDVATTGSILGTCVPGAGAKVSSALTVRPLTLRAVTLDNVNETIAVEQAQELLQSELNLDDLEDAIRQSSLNDAFFNLTVVNTADLPLVVSNFFVVAVRLDAAGQLLRDTGGNLIFETDGTGARIEAPVVDPGQTTFSVGRQGTSTVTVPAADLISHMVNLLIDGERVAFVAIGDAAAGDGTQSVVTNTDDVVVMYNAFVGLDFTIPAGGVSVTRNQTADGFELDSADADQIAARVVTASLSALVQNSTPFGLQIELALAPGALAETVDVFAQPGAVVLQPISLTAPTTDANGVPTGSVQDSVALSITGTDSRLLFDSTYTAGIRFTLMPRSGGGRRGAVLPGTGIGVDAAAVIVLRQGTGGGS